MLFVPLGILAIVLALVIRRVLKKGRPGLVRGLVIAEAAILLFGLAYVADRRISQLQDEVRSLRAKLNTSATEQIAATPPRIVAAAVSPRRSARRSYHPGNAGGYRACEACG